jgi:hypothetical protein
VLCNNHDAAFSAFILAHTITIMASIGNIDSVKSALAIAKSIWDIDDEDERHDAFRLLFATVSRFDRAQYLKYRDRIDMDWFERILGKIDNAPDMDTLHSLFTDAIERTCMYNNCITREGCTTEMLRNFNTTATAAKRIFFSLMAREEYIVDLEWMICKGDAYVLPFMDDMDKLNDEWSGQEE